MKEKESYLSCGMKSSAPASVDISYTPSCSTDTVHNRVHTSKKVLGYVSAIYVISNYFEQFEEQEKQWWPEGSVHTAITFLKSKKSA